MKKIKKVNQISAQSVYSFGCPCKGYCATNCGCRASDSHSSNDVNEMSRNNPHRTTGV
ncbi:hypothetical protein [Sporanaerobacter acetigenes]|uniref:Putative bacteriocin, CLI_3235 family n=1 Tax=Sporanaerobacter acetigenes DSM 13106 TaxID=1123281 RepID=A0A1M5UIN3_9FIRM|nr:hypothetical protein [Sporanaerobacter acetigenes]SHH62894.1 putative bacteriocin precursor, CLI_3235 family [Sporanaerobacter acetigenes DSM 13106]